MKKNYMEVKAEKAFTNLYDQICATDVISPIKQYIMNGSFKMGVDGTIKMNPVLIPDRPWLNASHCPDRACGIWMDVMFKHYQIIPNGCRNCWKLAMRPKTLKDLFTIREFQLSMKQYPSKCGMEQRGYTHNKGGYGAFWYNPLDGGLQVARERHKEISRLLDKIVPGHGLILKRGCTEMENMTLRQGKGGSEDWDKDAEYYDSSEAVIAPIFIDNDSILFKELEEPWHVVKHTIRRWIEWAFEHGDETYMEFTGGPLMPPLNLYHDSKHKHYNYKSTFTKETNNDSPSNETDADGADNIRSPGDSGCADDEGRLSVV